MAESKSEVLVDDKSKKYIDTAIYNFKLTPVRKDLIERILKNLDSGILSWHKGWKLKGAPVSAITGKSYKGVNNIYLTLIAMERGYQDNRWVTFNQIKKNNWHFKLDKEGGYSLGHGAGVTIEFFTLYDNNTRKPFDDKSLSYAKLDDREKLAYVEKHVKPIRQFATVYNLDLVEGPQPMNEDEFSFIKVAPKAEKLIKYWNENECKIFYDEDDSYYSISADEIHMPNRYAFDSLNEFYCTCFHEIAHSTGSENRLNRKMKNKYGSSMYALEELRAEIASVFIEQEVGVGIGAKDLKNNSAYIQSWKQELSYDPNALFRAIADAQKIADYVSSRSKAYLLTNEDKKEIRYSYTEQLKMDEAILNDRDLAFRKEPYCKITAKDGSRQIAIVAKYGGTGLFNDGEIAKNDDEYESMVRRMTEIDGVSGDSFKEVSFNELSAISIDRAKRGAVLRLENLDKKPSEVIKLNVHEPRRVDMKDRGVNSLKYMADRELVEKAFNSLAGDKFKMLYMGESLYNHEERDERALMLRIAAKSSNLDQSLRVFESSGQYREGKNAFYADLALEAHEFIKKLEEESKASKKSSKKESKKTNQNQKVRG